MRLRFRQLVLLSSGLSLILWVPTLVGQAAPDPNSGNSDANVAGSQTLSPEQMPPKSPRVTCDANRLTISAENSTLAAVLEAVHMCTGAQMEVPDSAAQERLFASLGPGPVRQILGEFLSSTDFNYLIQSSDADPQKIRAIVVMARTSNESGTMTASGAMSPNRRAWQQARRNASTEYSGVATDEAKDVSSASEIAAPAPAEAAVTLPADQPAVTPDVPASSPSLPAVEASSSKLETAPVHLESGSLPSPSSNTPQMIEDMRHMFEQRRQLQMQERQTSAPK